MSEEKSTRDTVVEALIQDGLDFWEQSRDVEAIRCWREVLSRRPEEPRALRYLEELGVPAVPSSRRGPPATTSPMPA